MNVADSTKPVTALRHARAVALLPFTNTVAIPAALLWLFPSAPPTIGAAAIAGAALAVCGALLVVHCIRLFVRFGNGTLAPWDPTRALVAAGAYRYIRNPMKAGLFLVLAGEALFTQSPALISWFVCFALANIVYIRLHEEPGLEARFGDRYRDYCARVPRWWPKNLRSQLKSAAQEART